jgi:uncharacterized Zn finger protein (UPF0148 family)
MICPSCGNELAAGSAFCPHCGTKQEPAVEQFEEQQMAEVPVEAPAANGFQDIIDKVLATTTTHKWWWVGGGSGALVVVVLAVLFFTGVFGPSGAAICKATLAQAKDFGVISQSASLASNSAKSTDVDGRKQCSADAGSENFVLLVDVKNEDAEHKTCKDFAKQADCIKLYSVARSDGMTTYQVREIPPDQTDEAVLAAQGQGAAPGATPAAGGGQAGPPESGGFDAPTAVDNGANAAPDQTAPAQPAPSGPQQQ